MMKDCAAKLHVRLKNSAGWPLLVLAAACAATPPPIPERPPVSATAPQAKPPAPPADPAPKPAVPPAPSTASDAVFRAVAWSELPGWRDDNVSEAWSALTASCGTLGSREAWREACAAAKRVTDPKGDAARRYFEQNFIPYRIASAESGEEGLITGYYEPLLRGSRKPSERYRHPVYGVPDDLVVVDLSEVYPELKNMRLRGRLEGRRLVPYPDRAQIESGQAAPRGKEIAWVDDAIDLFFLQIQGSGRILLDTGETLRVGYADQNGRPYRSIGRVLVDRGEMTLDRASMQSIKAWARKRPSELNELLNSNASYVFFRELPAGLNGPLGALGVPLTARRSIAIDPRHVPLGAPVFIATTWPNNPKPLNRLMLAQDTGGAIRGPVRADFFWGYGEAAGTEAGRMKQRLRMWVLLPHAHPVPGAAARE